MAMYCHHTVITSSWLLYTGVALLGLSQTASSQIAKAATASHNQAGRVRRRTLSAPLAPSADGGASLPDPLATRHLAGVSLVLVPAPTARNARGPR